MPKNQNEEEIKKKFVLNTKVIHNKDDKTYTSNVIKKANKGIREEY